MIRVLVFRLALAVVAFGTLSTERAHAHLGSTKYVSLSRTGDGVRVVALVERADVAIALGLPPSASERDIAAHARSIGPWLARGLTLSTPGRCTPTPGTPGFATREGRRFVAITIAYRCRGNARITLRDETVFPDDPQHEAIVSFSDGAHASGVLRRGRQTITLGEPPTIAPSESRFFAIGMSDFVYGYDHVLFLLALLLPLGLVVQKEGRRKALDDTVWLVGAFTAGLGLTLVFATIGLVALPSKPVEVSIAVSIVAAAIHNVLRPTTRGPARGLAFAFGLVHGLGFSGTLVHAGLSREGLVGALVAFGVGIVVALFLFVVAFAVAVRWASRFSSYERVAIRGGSAVIAVLGTLAVLERLAR